MVHHEFRFRLAHGREEAGLTREAIEDRLGLHPGTVKDWEDGTRPEPGDGMMAMLARVIDKPASYLDHDRFDKPLSENADKFAEYAIAQRMTEGRAEGLWKRVMAVPGYRGAVPWEIWQEFDHHQAELDL